MERPRTMFDLQSAQMLLSFSLSIRSIGISVTNEKQNWNKENLSMEREKHGKLEPMAKCDINNVIRNIRSE